MRASKRSRNRRGVGLPLDVPVKRAAPDSFPVMPDDLKIDIARVVRTFCFTGVDAGTCLARAAIGHAVLHACGLPARLIPGGMLYRCGPHRRRDTLRFCLPDNRGGYLHTGNDAYLIGHVWVEVGDEIADFSVGDWQAEADLIYENTVDPADRALGPIEWWVSPPQFIWQSAASLKTGWRAYGEPMIGQSWYGAWSPCRMPDFASFDLVVSDAAPLIALLVGELHLRERIADHLSSAAMVAPQILQSEGHV
jgi:hypothetical protein